MVALRDSVVVEGVPSRGTTGLQRLNKRQRLEVLGDALRRHGRLASAPEVWRGGVFVAQFKDAARAAAAARWLNDASWDELAGRGRQGSAGGKVSPTTHKFRNKDFKVVLRHLEALEAHRSTLKLEAHRSCGASAGGGEACAGAHEGQEASLSAEELLSEEERPGEASNSFRQRQADEPLSLEAAHARAMAEALAQPSFEEDSFLADEPDSSDTPVSFEGFGGVGVALEARHAAALAEAQEALDSPDADAYPRFRPLRHYWAPDHLLDARATVPRPIRNCVGALDDAGFSALVQGGAVRDMLLGREPKDVDVTTDAAPRVALKVLRAAGFKGTQVRGRNLQLLIVRTLDAHFELGSRDTLAEASDRRRPHGTNVRNNRAARALAERAANEGLTLERSWVHNMLTRDFTVNGMTWDTMRNVVYDAVGGWDDLRARRVDTIDHPMSLFANDPPCMLRAVRVATRIGGWFPEPVREAIATRAPLLKKAHKQRLIKELHNLICYGKAAESVQFLRDLGLLEYMLPVQANIFANADDGRDCALDARDVRDAWDMTLASLAALDTSADVGRPHHPVVLVAALAAPLAALRLASSSQQGATGERGVRDAMRLLAGAVAAQRKAVYRSGVPISPAQCEALQVLKNTLKSMPYVLTAASEAAAIKMLSSSKGATNKLGRDMTIFQLSREIVALESLNHLTDALHHAAKVSPIDATSDAFDHAFKTRMELGRRLFGSVNEVQAHAAALLDGVAPGEALQDADTAFVRDLCLKAAKRRGGEPPEWLRRPWNGSNMVRVREHALGGGRAFVVDLPPLGGLSPQYDREHGPQSAGGRTIDHMAAIAKLRRDCAPLRLGDAAKLAADVYRTRAEFVLSDGAHPASIRKVNKKVEAVRRHSLHFLAALGL